MNPTNPKNLKNPMHSVNRRQALAWAGAGLASTAFNARAADSRQWEQTLVRARGQTVYFNAWGGSDAINRYIQWAGQQVQQRYGVKLEHVKVSDAADVVKRVRNEKTAGTQAGSVDLVWINGENFLAMKREGLLHGPLNASLPNYPLVDTVGKPTTQVDFAEPVEGMEVPWGMAQLTFLVDGKRVPQPPQNTAELQAFARANPGRVSYPRPPDFHGTTFLKQVLLELNPDRSALYKPYAADAFERAALPLWTYLDTLHPYLWRSGKQFVQSAAATRQMLADGELLFALTFNPNDAANEIAAKRMASTVVSYQFAGGTVGNTHFVAVPFNARAKEGAVVLADFLLSPEAQARKADIAVWGDPTVLAVERLSASQQALFKSKPLPGQVAKSAPAIPEPHGSWVGPLEQAWLKRYGS
jgi:putative thiamine transport system substrate-binding protein